MSFSNQKNAIDILLIDDDEDDYILTRDILLEINHIDYHLDWEMNYNDARKCIMDEQYDVYLIDYRLGKLDGLTLISEAIEAGIVSPMILLTGKGDKEIDMRAMQEGASDYLVKSEITADILERTIRYSLSHSQSIKQVAEKELKYRQLFEQSIDAIYLTDLEFNLLDVNPSFCNLLNCDYDRIIGESMSSFFEEHQEHQELKQELYRQSGQLTDYEIKLIGGKEKHLICQVTMLERHDHNGVKNGYQGIIHDMSLKKRAEEELLLAERLSMTGKLARSIAHEVRNPLTNLGLAMDQLEDEVNTKEDVKLYSDIIRRNIKRIDQLITDLLNSSKPKEFNQQLYSVDQLIEETVDLVKDRIMLKGIQLDMHFEKTNDFIKVDYEKMKIALLNILVNAIEAIEDGKGELLVNCKTVEESVYIRISDNGQGISEEDQELLFDPFFTQKKNGMGLGLTTTQSIVHGHKGQIRVSSRSGEGTSFTVCLPKHFPENPH